MPYDDESTEYFNSLPASRELTREPKEPFVVKLVSAFVFSMAVVEPATCANAKRCPKDTLLHSSTLSVDMLLTLLLVYIWDSVPASASQASKYSVTVTEFVKPQHAAAH